MDEHSLWAIRLNVQIKYGCQHFPAPEHDYVEDYDDYSDKYDSYQAKYMYPRSRVPKRLEYKTTYDSIFMDLSSASLSRNLGSASFLVMYSTWYEIGI